MNAKFLQLFRIPETRQKILATLGLLLAYRFGFQIPIPGMDAGFDGGFDAGMIDAGMIDAGFDGGFDGGFDAGAPPSCGSIYGSTDGYELCSFDGMSCTFYYNPSGGSRARCREICGSSARCLGAFHDTDDSCGIGAATTCDDDEWDNICVCVRTP